MPPELIEAMAPLTAVVAIGTMILIGMKMRWTAKAKLQQGSSGEELVRLADAVDGLTDEVRTLREEHGELEERVDFAERLLAQGKSRDAIGPRESTPV